MFDMNERKMKNWRTLEALGKRTKFYVREYCCTKFLLYNNTNFNINEVLSRFINPSLSLENHYIIAYRNTRGLRKIFFNNN